MINEPLTGCRSSHRLKKPPPYCMYCASLCMDARAHPHMVRIDEKTWVALCGAVPTPTYRGGQWPYQPSYLAALSSKKTRENEGSNASLWNVSLCWVPAHSDLSFTVSVYLVFHFFCQATVSVKYLSSNRSIKWMIWGLCSSQIGFYFSSILSWALI